MKQTTKLTIALMALLAMSACEGRNAARAGFQTASIQWDEIAATTESVGHAPKNANLIFMR